MEQNPVVKRLYVGGLDYTVSEAELRERFCKFGNVTDTEIVTRKDEKGNPTKTFAYINITLSEKDLRKCIFVLNKTKWKGGTLQIELAKECFLHRLAQERQEANVKKEKTSCNGMGNILESMKKSGVVDFQMKAVPGTEISDHKDWVVGKFGRVLPVLHMKGQHTNKIMKYDPSKYCHNLKKLDSDFSEQVPVSQLTWHLEEDDNIISKKRQGHFPVYMKPPKKKMRIQTCDSLSRTELKSCCQLSSKTTNVHMTELVQNHTPTVKHYKKHSVNQKFVSGAYSNANRPSESDIDTDDEIRAIIAGEKDMQKGNPNIKPEDDNIEVVGEDFELKYSTHWSLKKAHTMKKVCREELKSTENESDYDSADTDDIIAVTRPSNQKKREKEALNVSKGTEEKDGRFKKGMLSQASRLNESTSDKLMGEKRATPEKMNYGHSNIANHGHWESDDLYLATSESEGDEDYETMMRNCYRLDLTLEDLEQLAYKKAESTDDDDDDDDTECNHTDTRSKTNEFPGSNTKKIPKVTTGSPAPKKCICPEEILAAILKEERAEKENPKERDSPLKVQPFRGIGSLCENETKKKLTKGELDAHKSKTSCGSSDFIGMGTVKSTSDSWCSDSEIKNPNCKLLSLRKTKSDPQKGNRILKTNENSDCSTLSTKERVVTESTKVSTNLKSFPKRTPLEINYKESDLSENLKNSSLKHKKTLLGSAKATVEKQQQDNEKRLAALQEKQKQRDLQKRLIQGALSQLEIQSTNKQKHVIFDSDDESEAEVPVSTEEVSQGKLLGKEFSTKTSGKLFESSEDESDTAEEEDRFKIKPQFEGKAGEKLRQLQSRFGTDERFRMDARFLESDSEPEDELRTLKIDEEEELALEKKKNLEILKNLLHINVEHPKPTKQATSARKFKDINSLRYDPTRQEHAIFERKPENTEKESKVKKKKKKKEEAQKLPEVSKEIFYDVAVNLREVLESTKFDEKPKIIPWDKHDDIEEAIPADVELLNIKDKSNKQEETSGFTFSFFGVEVDKSPMKEEPYLIKTIKPSKVAWQEDPRFQDSSSEDDNDPEVVEKEFVKEMSPSVPYPNIRFFFFSQDDDRLKEGPKLFCRSSDLDEERDDWESRRQMLLEDCRKKHKDARRKVKAKH